MGFFAPAPIDPIDVVVVRGPGPARWVANTPAGTWDPTRLPVTFVLAPPRSRDVGEAAGAEIEVALRTWSRVACTGFRGRFDGERASAVAADDGVNVVVFHDDAWPSDLVPGVVAQTVVHVDANGKIRDTDIHLNGADFRFSLDGAPGTQDLRSVLVHEIGHALGLGHSTDARATMNASGSGLRWRSLEKDDIDGVCALYPGLGAPGCPTDACPAGFVCVGGACQRPGTRADLCSPCTAAVECEASGDDARCVDIGKGRVCGRTCASDGECGAGFACRATTEAGDRQCVADDGCKSAANPCVTDEDCKGFVCREGACVGAGTSAVDAGAPEASADAAPSSGPAPASGGCDCVAALGRSTGGRSSGAPSLVALALFVAALCERRRRRRSSGVTRRAP